MLVDASIKASFRTAVRYPYIQFIEVVLHFFGHRDGSMHAGRC